MLSLRAGGGHGRCAGRSIGIQLISQMDDPVAALQGEEDPQRYANKTFSCVEQMTTIIGALKLEAPNLDQGP